MLLTSLHVKGLTQDWWCWSNWAYILAKLTLAKQGGTKFPPSHVHMHMGHNGSYLNWAMMSRIEEFLIDLLQLPSSM